MEVTEVDDYGRKYNIDWNEVMKLTITVYNPDVIQTINEKFYDEIEKKLEKSNFSDAKSLIQKIQSK